MDNEEKIGELCAKFEKDAKKLGYQLEALTLYNKREDRHQINWNDKAKGEEKTGACEGLGICFIMLAEGDEELIATSLKAGSANTPYWRKFLDPTPYLNLADKAVDIGISTGEQILDDFKEVIDSVFSPEEPIKMEGDYDDDKKE